MEAGGGEEVGEGFGAAEAEGVAVVGEGGVFVLVGLEVELEGAELGDAVFDVVEGDVEEVELALPEGFLVGLEAGEVGGAAEAGTEVEPCLGALGGGVAGVGVDPVLEGVDGGDPGEDADVAFELEAFGAGGGVGGGGVVDVEVFAAEEFHGHGGDFAELDRG